MEMVERVAQQISDGFAADVSSVDIARAVITAMREPTGIVLQSAIVAHESCHEDGWGENAMLDAWQAAIDAALAPAATKENVDAQQ